MIEFFYHTFIKSEAISLSELLQLAMLPGFDTMAPDSGISSLSGPAMSALSTIGSALTDPFFWDQQF